VHPEQPEPGELAEELARQDPLLEPVPDVGQDALPHELAHGVADRTLLVVEQPVDVEIVVRVERGAGLGRRHGVLPGSPAP